MSNIGQLYMIPSVLAENTHHQTLPSEISSKIKELNHFAVENIRTARRFIRSLDQEKIIDDVHFELLDKNTKPNVIQKIIDNILYGNSVGVISEAGCPGIADPGAKLVEKAHENGIKVVPMVGPSSILLALMASGMNGQSFTFCGYLPIQDKERKQQIKELERNAIQKNQTQIFMETPYRNNQLLEDLIATCSPNTKLCIACNITAPDQYIETMTLKDWKTIQIDLHKKPTMFVLGK